MSLQISAVTLLPALAPLAGVLAVLVADLVSPRMRVAPYVIGLLGLVAAAAAALPGLGSARRTFCLPDAAHALPGAPSPLPAVGVAPAQCFWNVSSLGAALQLAAALAGAVCLALAWPRAAGTGSSSSAAGSSSSAAGSSSSAAGSSSSAAGSPRATSEQSASGPTAAALPASRSASVSLGHRPALEPIEVVLLLTAVTGAVTVPAARDLGTWLVAVELATLPTVALVALSRRRAARDQVAAAGGAVQLLVTSLLSFAMLVLGAGVWLLATGSVWLDADAALSAPAPALAVAVGLFVAGLAFKLSLVPFHSWTPVAFSGASTPVAALLATVSKIAALGALAVVVSALAALGRPGALAVGVIAAATMTVGNVVALRQHDVVRLLAWSTVAQAGWVVLPLVALSPGAQGAAGAYLLALVAASVVAFAVVRVVELRGYGRSLAGQAGLWRRSPLAAGALALALTSLAGLPPGVVGLVAKIEALAPVLRLGWIWLALVAVVNVVLGIAVYLRWLHPVLLGEPARPERDDTGHREDGLARGPRTDPGREATVDGAEPSGIGPDVPTREVPRVVLGALWLATVVLVAVCVQPDLVLGLVR